MKDYKSKITGAVVSEDMLFLNDYSDGGAASLHTCLSAIANEWEVVPEMTEQERYDYTKVALRICGVNADDYAAELIVRACDLVFESKGDTDMRSMCRLLAEVRKKYDKD